MGLDGKLVMLESLTSFFSVGRYEYATNFLRDATMVRSLAAEIVDLANQQEANLFNDRGYHRIMANYARAIRNNRGLAGRMGVPTELPIVAFKHKVEFY